MKKKAALIATGLLLVGGTGGYLFWDNAYNFTGNEKTVNRDFYYADFDSFNGEDVFEVDMKKGDRIHIDAHGEKGKLKLSIIQSGSKEGYVISNIEDVNSDFTADTTGTYVVTVTAKHAKGKIDLKCTDLPEDKAIRRTK